METEDLIRALARDPLPPGPSPGSTLALATALAALAAGLVWAGMLGPRGDLQAAAQTLRFLFKPAFALMLAAGALLGVAALLRPGERSRGAVAVLAAAAIAAGLALALEFWTVPADERMVRLVGTNAGVCLTFIPLIGAVPLALLLLAARRGAATAPSLTGAACGLAAGGLAAAFYAAHCPDDSPFFVLTWYPLAIAILTAAGALIGRAALRW